MKTHPRESKTRLKARFIPEAGRLVIRVTPYAAGAGAHFVPECTSAHGVVGRQPEPKQSGITRKMVREFLPQLLRDGLLERAPVTTSEWLLAEWHLARMLNYPRLRIAHFVSEILRPTPGSVRRILRSA